MRVTYSYSICGSFNYFGTCTLQASKSLWHIHQSRGMGVGGGGGHVSLGPVHHPHKSLSEKHPKRGWSDDDTHSSLNTTPRVRTGLSIPNFLPFPRTCRSRGSVDLIPFFHIFLFLIPLTRYARYVPGGEKDTLFTRFYLRGWCTSPNETCPPGHQYTTWKSIVYTPNHKWLSTIHQSTNNVHTSLTNFLLMNVHNYAICRPTFIMIDIPTRSKL